MTPSRPYLIRALNEWILDNNCTPHLLVDAAYQQVVVPTQFVENGKITLNISPTAVQGLSIDNEWISFSARFSGRTFSVFVPVFAILAIYARENGQGMSFQPEEYNGVPVPDADPDPEPPKPKRPVLRRVK